MSYNCHFDRPPTLAEIQEAFLFQKDLMQMPENYGVDRSMYEQALDSIMHRNDKDAGIKPSRRKRASNSNRHDTIQPDVPTEVGLIE